MQRLVRLSILPLLFVLACHHQPPTLGPTARTLVVILHTNDTHGYVWGDDEIGSAAHRAGLVAQIRADVADRDGLVLLLDAGDVRTGSYCSDTQRAEPDLAAMEAMGYDAMVVGNHEFDQPYTVLLEQRERLDFPLLGANVLRAETGQPLVAPWTLIERGGLRIAILGLVTSTSATTSSRGADPALRFADATEVARRQVPQLRSGADLLIVLSHLGLEADRELAGAVDGIDVIVGGHSHDALERPLVEGETLIVQTGSNGRALGRLDLMVGPQGVELVSGQLLPVTPELPPDPQVAALLERFACDTNDEVIVELAEPVTHEPLEGLGSSSALSNLIADALREELGTDLAIVNKGGIRTDLPAGPVTTEELHAVLPFDNSVVVLEATGAQLLDIARSVHSRGRDGRGILFTSGMTFEFGPGDHVQVLIDSAPPEPERGYTIAISEFVARGGDGHDALASLPRVREAGQTTAQVLAHYLRQRQEVTVDRQSRTLWRDQRPSRPASALPATPALAR